MNRLTYREINENGRDLAKQLRGLSVADAKQVLAQAGRVIEDESMTDVQDSDQIEMHVGPSTLGDGFESMSEGLVDEGNAHILQRGDRGITTFTDDERNRNVTIPNSLVLQSEGRISTMRAFNHNNLQPTANHPSKERQEQIPDESASEPQRTV